MIDYHDRSWRQKLEDAQIYVETRQQKYLFNYFFIRDASWESECVGADIVEVVRSWDNGFGVWLEQWILQGRRQDFIPVPLLRRYLGESMHQSRDHNFYAVVHLLDSSIIDFSERRGQACVEVALIVFKGNLKA